MEFQFKDLAISRIDYWNWKENLNKEFWIVIINIYNIKNIGNFMN